MGSILDNLGQLIVQYPAWKYPLIAGGMILQGEVAILILVYLVVNQSLTWKEFILVGLSALFIGESLVYAGGKILRHTRLGWRIYKKIKPNRRLQFYFFYLRKNLIKLFIISKFLPATNFVLFFLTGWTKTKWRQFAKSYLTSLFIWFTTMSIVAYFLVSGLYYLKVTRVFRQVEIGILILILIVFGVEYVLKRLLKKTVAIQEKAGVIGQLIEKEIKNPRNGKSPGIQ